jgi:hypothetical protein
MESAHAAGGLLETHGVSFEVAVFVVRRDKDRFARFAHSHPGVAARSRRRSLTLVSLDGSRNARTVVVESPESMGSRSRCLFPRRNRRYFLRTIKPFQIA